MPSPLASVLVRLDTLNRKIDSLVLTAGANNGHTAAPTLLVGWREISAFARKNPHTLAHYRLIESFPAIRWGRHVVSSPALIEGWLLTHEKRRRLRKAAEPPVMPLAPPGAHKGSRQ